MWEIWTIQLLPKALKSCPKSNRQIWSHCRHNKMLLVCAMVRSGSGTVGTVSNLIKRSIIVIYNSTRRTEETFPVRTTLES